MKHEDTTMKSIKLCDHPKLELAHKVLQEIPNAIIAGDTARDILLGNDYGNITIYVPITNEIEASAHGILLGRLLQYHGIDWLVCPYEYKSDFIVAGYEVENLNILFVFEGGVAEEIIRQFNIVMSEAWMTEIDDGFELHATDLFYELNERKILGYYHKIPLYEENELEQLVENFPGYMKLELFKPSLHREMRELDEIPF